MYQNLCHLSYQFISNQAETCSTDLKQILQSDLYPVWWTWTVMCMKVQKLYNRIVQCGASLSLCLIEWASVLRISTPFCSDKSECVGIGSRVVSLFLILLCVFLIFFVFVSYSPAPPNYFRIFAGANLTGLVTIQAPSWFWSGYIHNGFFVITQSAETHHSQSEFVLYYSAEALSF